MKHLKLFLTFALIFSSIDGIAQSQTKLFKKVNAYIKKHQNSDEPSKMEFNSAEKMLKWGKFRIPLEDVEILYQNIRGAHVVTFECENCILNIGEDNMKEYTGGVGIEFGSQAECYDFIDLVGNFRDKVL